MCLPVSCILRQVGGLFFLVVFLSLFINIFLLPVFCILRPVGGLAVLFRFLSILIIICFLPVSRILRPVGGPIFFVVLKLLLRLLPLLFICLWLVSCILRPVGGPVFFLFLVCFVYDEYYYCNLDDFGPLPAFSARSAARSVCFYMIIYICTPKAGPEPPKELPS